MELVSQKFIWFKEFFMDNLTFDSLEFKEKEISQEEFLKNEKKENDRKLIEKVKQYIEATINQITLKCSGEKKKYYIDKISKCHNANKIVNICDNILKKMQ